MMWIVAIIGVLFYDMSMSNSFLLGAVGGLSYVVLASLARKVFGWCGHVIRMRMWERERLAMEREMSRERVERERRRRGVGLEAGGLVEGQGLSEPLLISVEE